MRTRSKSYPFNSTATIPRRSNRRRFPNIVKPEICTIKEIVPIADRTMEELRQAPTEGDVLNDAIKLMLFPYSLEGAARIWYEKEPPNSILTWDDLVNKFVNQFFPPSKTTYLKNEISRFSQRFEETFGEAWDRFKEMLRACPHHGFSELTQIDTFYNGLTDQDQDSLNAASGGNLLNKTTRNALKIIENKSKVHYSRSKSNVSMVNTNSRDNVSKTDDRIDKLADQISNLVEIVNKQVIAHAKAVEKTLINLVFVRQLVLKIRYLRQTEQVTKFHHPVLLRFKTIQTGSTAQIQPPVVPISIPEPDVPRTQPKPTIPYLFADALILMPKFSSTIKSLLTNKDKLFELAKVPLNENCSAMLLIKLPEKLGDPELTPTRMTLELADRSITRPKGVAEDVFVKVGKFYFLTDFMVVDFEADPRAPLILGRSFLRTDRALIDVYGEEITLRYNPNSSNPTLVSDPSVSESDSCKVPIVKASSPTLTPFGESDFFLKEIEDFLNDDSIPTGIENSVYDPEGDILFLEKALVFILEIAPLFLGFESGDKDDSLCLPKMSSITIHSIFAYGKLKSLTNQSLNCVLNAFDFPPIRAAFSLQDKDARRVIEVIRLTSNRIEGEREIRVGVNSILKTKGRIRFNLDFTLLVPVVRWGFTMSVLIGYMF
uniref:Reverse transcriptase domain-containing protein n=1 Tax=Tanacetum cinerariifolium TaxID=118510 RepID=A0A6L2NK48_TANCI|nr:reverse transcriptase domain-containing protein [Tanacetum cinerariifolium]